MTPPEPTFEAATDSGAGPADLAALADFLIAEATRRSGREGSDRREEGPTTASCQ
jgi:hypothetical protein